MDNLLMQIDGIKTNSLEKRMLLPGKFLEPTLVKKPNVSKSIIALFRVFYFLGWSNFWRIYHLSKT